MQLLYATLKQEHKTKGKARLTSMLKSGKELKVYVLMPECPGMTDEEAAVVLKWWCRRNDIPYNDDMYNIEAAYRW